MLDCTFFVEGVPKPKGNLARCPSIGRGRRMYDKGGGRLLSWMKAIRLLAIRAWDGKPSENPIRLTLDFYLRRPASHFRTEHMILRGDAPLRPIGKPDFDKLERAVADALTGAVYDDDSQVVECTTRLYWCAYRAALSGVQIQVEEL